MLKNSEIRGMEKSAIQNKIDELKKGLFNLKLQKATTGVEKSHLVSETRKDIARLLTILNEKNRN